MIELFIDWIILAIKIIGGLVIIWGMIITAYHSIRHLSKNIHKAYYKELDEIRIEFGKYILLSLEIFIAADIFATFFLPSWTELGQLVVIVAIRTVLSYTLSWEFKTMKKVKKV